MINQYLHNYGDKQILMLKLMNLKKADECFDWCLLLLAKATLRGESHYCHLKVDLWKKRVWNAIEEAGLLPE